MGWFTRASERSSAQFWALAQLRAGERQIEYAHLAFVFDTGDQVVTGFVTDQRLIFVSPQGRRIEIALTDIDGWTLRTDIRPGRTAMSMGVKRAGGAVDVLIVGPQNASRANKLLAHNFYTSFAQQFQRVHPDATTEPGQAN